MTTSELRKNLLGRNCLSTIRFSDRQHQFCFLLGRELKASFVILGQNSDGRALFEGNALEDHFSTNDFSGCHFHIAEDTPVRIPLRHDAQQDQYSWSVLHSVNTAHNWQVAVSEGGTAPADYEYYETNIRCSLT